MKKALSVVLALVLALSLVACGGEAPASEPASTPAETSSEASSEASAPAEDVSAPAAEGGVKTGLGIIANGAVKGEASADGNGKVQSNTTTAAVLVDSEGKILDCKLDVAQTTTEYTTEGKVVATEDFRTKMEKGADYGMVNASEIKKEWDAQATAFAEYVIGKTAEEVKAIPQLGEDKHSGPDVADLAASCTMNVTDFKAAIAAAVESAQDLGAQAGDKLGMGVVTNMPAFSNKDASADGEGSIQHDTTVAVTTTNADGKLTSNLFDVTQTKYTVAADGKATCTTETVTSKHALGADYGMVNASSIKKEWFEQADAFMAYVNGMTAAEIEAIPQLGADKHNAADVADLAASCTMDVTDFKAALVKAAK